MYAGDALYRLEGQKGELSLGNACRKLFQHELQVCKRGSRIANVVEGNVKQRWLVEKRGVRGVSRGAIKVSSARSVSSRDDAPSVHVLGRFSSPWAGRCTTLRSVTDGTFGTTYMLLYLDNYLLVC
jgi:hypothetical protein